MQYKLKKPIEFWNVCVNWKKTAAYSSLDLCITTRTHLSKIGVWISFRVKIESINKIDVDYLYVFAR